MNTYVDERPNGGKVAVCEKDSEGSMQKAGKYDPLPRGFHVEGEAFQPLTEEDLELERQANEILDKKCTKCRTRTPLYGNTRCERCKAVDAEKREQWKAEGRCWQCGREVPFKSRYCTKCKRAWRRFNNRREDI